MSWKMTAFSSAVTSRKIISPNGPWCVPRIGSRGQGRGSRHAERGLPEPLAGIVPVLAIQGGGYVVAGLAMLIWLRADPAGSGSDHGAAEAPGDGELALVVVDEGLRLLP